MTLSELYNNVSKDILPLVLAINEKGKYTAIIEFSETCIYVAVYTKPINQIIFFHNIGLNSVSSMNCFEIGDKRYGDLDYNQIIDRLKTRFN